MAEIPIDPGLCPLCAGPNACAMVDGGKSCWCFSAPIDREAIERVPAEARGIACICSKCGSSYNELNDATANKAKSSAINEPAAS